MGCCRYGSRQDLEDYCYSFLLKLVAFTITSRHVNQILRDTIDVFCVELFSHPLSNFFGHCHLFAPRKGKCEAAGLGFRDAVFRSRQPSLPFVATRVLFLTHPYYRRTVATVKDCLASFPELFRVAKDYDGDSTEGQQKGKSEEVLRGLRGHRAGSLSAIGLAIADTSDHGCNG